MFDDVDTGSGPSAEWSARKLEIWDHLGVIFLNEGFRNLTVGELADQLSCSRRTLYSLAASRDELVLGVVEHLFVTRAAVASDAVAKASDAGAAIVAHLSNGLMALDARAAFIDDVIGRAATSRIYRSYRNTSRNTLVGIVRKGVASRELRKCDPDLTADVLDAAADRLAERRHRDSRRLSLSEATQTLQALVGGWLVDGP